MAREIRILIIHLGALGDFILALPSIIKIKEIYKPYKIDMLGYPRINFLAKGFGISDTFMDIESAKFVFLFDSKLEYYNDEIKFFKEYDLIYIFSRFHENSVVVKMKRLLRDRIKWISSLPPKAIQIHLSDYMIKQIGTKDNQKYQFPIWVSDESLKKEAKKIIEKAGIIGKAVILHPGSGSFRKAWPLKHYIALANLIADKGIEVLFLTTPVDLSFIEEKDIKMAGYPVINVESLKLIPEIILLSDSFIGNDSGLSHLSAALNIKTLAIFGPTNPMVWAPKGKYVFVLKKEYHCSPCWDNEEFSPCYKECLKQITPEEVLSAWMNLKNRV